jgi:uncharacterized protein (DUF1015 family)
MISPAERLRFEAANPHNVVRLVLGEDRPGDDEHDDKYMRAASLLRTWRRERVLVPTPNPSYYAYEMRFAFRGERRRLRGLVALVDLEDRDGSITPHERTMAEPVEDRLRLMRAVRANLSCIHAVYPGPCEPIASRIDAASVTEPIGSLADEEGVEHRVWSIAVGDEIAPALTDERVLIADGHHRYAMALRYRDEMRASHGPGPWDRVMMLLVDSALEDPPVLPFHRMLTAGSSRPAGTRVRDLEEILSELDDDELVYGVAAHEEGELVHKVARLSGSPPTVCALHEQVLDALDPDLLFTPDAVEAEEAVRDGRAVAAYFLPATTSSRIRSVIERGDRLPQKSTFFWPKPRTGLLIRPLD